MGVLNFKKSSVENLIQLTKENPVMTPTFCHLSDKTFWRLSRAQTC